MPKTKTKQPKPPFEDEPLEGTIKAYCVSCRKKEQRINEPVLTAIYMPKSNQYRAAVIGTHKKCGTRMTRFVGQDFVDQVLDDD